MTLDILPESDHSSHRLVGKFFTNSTPPSLEVVEYSLRKQWIFTGEMTVNTHDIDLFLFDFTEEKDIQMILTDRPWNVNGIIIVIKEPSSDDIIDFTVTNFCISVEGWPRYYFTDEHIACLKRKISDKPIISEFILPKDMCLLFEAEIDLKKPLKPGYWLDQNWYVMFKYKNLASFCYNCGMIDHVKSDCGQELPEERNLNFQTTTPVYGSWLRLCSPPNWYEMFLKTSKKKLDEINQSEEIDPQFFVEVKFKDVIVSDSDSFVDTSSRHSFSFPCSYLEYSIDLSASKAREVIEREINENTPFSLGEFEDMSVNWPIKKSGDKSDVIGSLVEYLKEIRKDSESKFLSLKLEIKNKHSVTSVDYQTRLNIAKDRECVRVIESKISELIKKKVKKGDDLLCMSSWIREIGNALMKIDYMDYRYLFRVSERANEAIKEAVRMEISCGMCRIPEDIVSVKKLEVKIKITSKIDRFDPCVMCSKEMFLGEEATTFSCFHVFHSSCVKDGQKCPLCFYD